MRLRLAPGGEVVLPGLLRAHDRAWRQTGRDRAQEGGKGFAEVAGGDALEVEPGQELLDGTGPSEVRRQELALEPHAAAFRVDPLVVHPRPRNRDVPRAGLDRALGGVTVANDQAVSVGVALGRVSLDVLGDLGLDRVTVA